MLNSKKILSLVLVFVLALSLIACGGNSKTEETSSPAEKPSEAATESSEASAESSTEPTAEVLTGGGSNTIYIITPSHSNPFFKSEADAASAKAQELGYEVKTVSHDDDPTKQAELFETAISDKAAAIICDNAGADATVAAVQRARDNNIPTIVVISLILGAIVGLLNGLIITKFNVAPFIATLGMMYIARGFAMLSNNGATFANITGKEVLKNTGIEVFGRSIGLVPVSAIILLVIAIAASLVLKKTKFGWHVFAIGGNERAARLSGVKSDKVKIAVYMFSGVCAAIVGIITASQLVAAHPASGETWEMNAIAASVLGGTSMAGGIGTISGTIVGAFVIGVINDGMVMSGVSEFWQMIIRGLVIIVAVIVDQFQRNLQAKIALQSRENN